MAGKVCQNAIFLMYVQFLGSNFSAKVFLLYGPWWDFKLFANG